MLFRKQVALQPAAVAHPLDLGQPYVEHLSRIVPFVDRRGHIQPLVALQPDQLAAQRMRQHLGDLGLADPGVAFEKQRTLQFERQKHHRRQRASGKIVVGLQHGHRFIDAGGHGGLCGLGHHHSGAAGKAGYVSRDYSVW